MPVAFIRRMRLINVLSMIAFNGLEVEIISPFDELDIHHILDKLISQDAIIDIIDNEPLSYALATGNTDQLREVADEYPVLRECFETGWIHRYFNEPFDPICIILAARVKKLLDMIDELGHSYNLWNYYWSFPWPPEPIPPIPTPPGPGPPTPPGPPPPAPIENPCEHKDYPGVTVYISYTSGVMFLGEEQNLEVAGYDPKYHKNNYLWKISKGGGYLTDVDGDPAQKVYGPEEALYVPGAFVAAYVVTYHAPTANPGGVMNPTIELWCNFGKVYSVTIAINGYAGHDKIAYEISECIYSGGWWRRHTLAYWCDDVQAAEHDYGYWSTKTECEQYWINFVNCPCWIGYPGLHDCTGTGCYDPTLQSLGCFPEGLL